MPKIKAIPDGMLMMQNLMQRDILVPMDDVEHSIASVLSGLDMEVASTEGIRAELNNLRQKSLNEKAQVAGLCDALGSAANAFSNVDQQLSNQAQELTYLMNHASLGALIGNLTHAILPLIGIESINVSFGITKEGYSTIEAAMGMIHSYLDAEVSDASKVSSAGGEIYQYLQENDPNLLFGQYNYAIHFLNDVKWYDVMGYALLNWDKAGWAILTGGSIEGMAEAFLNDPDACKTILRKVIDDICGTNYLDVFSSGQEDVLGFIADLAEFGGFDGTSDFISSLNEAVGDAEIADKILKDYSANVAMLESLKEIAPNSGMLTQTVDDLLAEYKNQVAAMIFGDVGGKIQEGVIQLADYALGTSFGIADTVIEAVLGDVESLTSLDTVIFSTEIRGNAIQAFQNASQKIMSGNFTAEDLTAYQNSFNLAKALTIEQYEAMYLYYDAGSMEAKYLKSQIDQLESMSYTDFNYAQSFNSFNSDATSTVSGAVIGGVGSGGGGGGGRFG